jgi:hypothetical protein
MTRHSTLPPSSAELNASSPITLTSAATTRAVARAATSGAV